MGRTAVHVFVRCGNHFFRLLLCVDCLQSQRGCRQHAEVWRVYSRDPSRQAYSRPHQRDPDPHHVGGSPVSDHYLVHPGMDDYRHSSQPSLWSNWCVLRTPTYVDNEWLKRKLLLWRDLAVDSCRGRYGHGDPDRSSAGHASLRWLYPTQWTHSRAAHLVLIEYVEIDVGWLSSRWRHEIGIARPEGQFDGGGNLTRHRTRYPAWLTRRRQGYASQEDCRTIPHPADFNRRPVAG